MSPIHRRIAEPLLALAMLMPLANAGMANDDVPMMLESMPGMQLIAAVDAMHAGDLTKAEALFTLAIQQGKLAPEGLTHAWFNRGLVRQRMGNLPLAIADFSRALASDVLSSASRVEAYYNRGLAWRKMGELQKAMDDFSRAIELQPRFAPPYYSRALGLAANGHYLLALVDLDKAQKYGFAQQHKVHYSKAMIHLARGEQKAAISELRKALKIAPNFRPARQRLAALRGQGQRLAAGRLLPAGASGGLLHARLASLPEDDEVDPVAGASGFGNRVAARAASGETGRLAANRASGRMAKPRRRPARRVAAVEATARRNAPAVPDKARQHPGPRPDNATGMMVPTAFAGPPSALSRLITGSIAPVDGGRTSRTKSQARIASAGGAAHGAWGIQLASSRSERDMAMRWRLLRARVARVVPAPRVRIARASLKGRGIRYRLRLVGFASRQGAASGCEKLRSRGISCIVVRAR